MVDGGTSSTCEDRNAMSLGGSGSRTSADGAEHKTGYNSRWEATTLGYLTLRTKFDTKGCQNQSKIWNTEPCTTHHKDVLARHDGSAMHNEAVEQERACHVFKTRGGMREVVEWFL